MGYPMWFDVFCLLWFFFFFFLKPMLFNVCLSVPNHISTSWCGLICVLSVVCHMFLMFVCYKSCISRFDVCLLLSQVSKKPVWFSVCFVCCELCDQKSSMVWCVFCLLRVVWSKIQYGLMRVLSIASCVIKNPVCFDVCFVCCELCDQKSSIVWCVFCLLQVI